MRAVIIMAAVALILVEFVAFCVWLAHEPKHHHYDEED